MSDIAEILILNGPNLNLLGRREPSIYGNVGLDETYNELENLDCAKDFRLKFIQSNAEHELINAIHNSGSDNTKYILINAGALSHTSIAIRDALMAVEIPFIEIHISNIYKRESFRHKSYLSDIADGVITGFGVDGYKYALMFAINKLKHQL